MEKKKRNTEDFREKTNKQKLSNKETIMKKKNYYLYIYLQEKEKKKKKKKKKKNPRTSQLH